MLDANIACPNFNFNLNNTDNSKNENYTFTDGFLSFLEDTELSNIIKTNEKVKFTEIYIPASLTRLDNLELYRKYNFADLDNILKEFLAHPKNIFFKGSETSGKTSLLKYATLFLSTNNYLPIYIDFSKAVQFPIINYVNNIIKKIYKNDDNNFNIIINNKSFNTDKNIIFMLDNFHGMETKRQIKVLEDLLEIRNTHILATVEDIFKTEEIDKKIQSDIYEYRIKEFGKLKQHELIDRWLKLSKINENEINKNETFCEQLLDNTIIKKLIPSYPFFIYTILATVKNHSKIDSNITSQGHCYQAFIYLNLRNACVPENEIDYFLNLLREIVYHCFYNSGKYCYRDGVNKDKIKKFINNKYSYNLPRNKDADYLIRKLSEAKLLKISSLGNCRFEYPYIYYFFLGKYFANSIESGNKYESKKCKEDLYNLINNIDEEANAYTIIFLIHHTNNVDILEHLQTVILCSYNEGKYKYTEMTLDNNELDMDKAYKKINNLVIKEYHNPEVNKLENLKEQDIKSYEYNPDEYKYLDEAMILLRKSLKSVEVLGHIIKNRSGSIEKNKLTEYFEYGMNLLLRIGMYVSEQINAIDKSFICYIESTLKENMKEKKFHHDMIITIAKKRIADMQLMTCYSTIKHCTISLASENLIDCIEKINKKKSTTISNLIEHDIKMTYAQNIDDKFLKKFMEDDQKSIFVKDILRMIVYEYLYFYKVDQDEVDKICSILEIKNEGKKNLNISDKYSKK